MSSQALDIPCPNCAVPCSVDTPPDVRTTSWDVARGEAEIRCPTCGWEFIIDSDGTVADDGEVEPEAELEIDAEGECITPEPDAAPFPPWHGIASLAGENRGRRAWRDFCADPFDPDEEASDWVRIRRVGPANCPNCGQHFADAWMGPVLCPGCDWQFCIDCDEPEYDDEEEDGVYDFADPQSPEARALRPLIVSPSGHDDFTSIDEAVRRAEPGRRILVRPGLYEEEIGVNSPVEVGGDGPREQIIVVNRRGPCLSMQCSTAVVRGLTLRGLHRDGNRKSTAVELDFGLVEDCAITSASVACVKMQGGCLRRCRIHDGEAAGVVAGGGSIEECDILHNNGPGVEVQKDGSVLLARCRVHHGHAEGIVVNPGGHAKMVECDVAANARAGVVIRGERTLLWKCRIHDGAAEGIRIPDEGVGFIEHCAIFANARAGLRVAGGSVYAWRSRIHDGKGLGVGITGGGVIDLRRCAIYHNARAGIAVDAQTYPVVRRCRIRANQQGSRG